MTDAIEVKPRYLEPDSPAHIASTESLPTAIASTASQSKGWFTSMYENRIIVFIIVITILIICIAAYVIYKPREESDKPRVSGDKTRAEAQPPAASADNTANTPPSTTTPAAAQDAPPPTTPGEAKPSETTTPPHKPVSNLASLLARSKQVETQQTTQVNNIKSEEEIMQLMEDRSAYTEDSNNTTVQCDTAQTPSQHTPNDEISSDPNQSAPATKVDDGYCNMILPTGRRCRNRARPSGMCARHDN